MRVMMEQRKPLPFFFWDVSHNILLLLLQGAVCLMCACMQCVFTFYWYPYEYV